MENRSSNSINYYLLKVSFFAGPVLLFFSAMSFVLGVGLIPPGITSYVEGIFGSFALIFFVPIYLELSRQLGATHKKLGIITAFTGLCGAVVGVSHELFRVIEWTLRARGAGDEVWAAFYADPGIEYLSVGLLGPLFPVTSIILGIGFLKAGTMQKWIAYFLILAGIGFPLAQVAGWEIGLKITYPLATVLWLVSLIYIGINYIKK